MRWNELTLAWLAGVALSRFGAQSAALWALGYHRVGRSRVACILTAVSELLVRHCTSGIPKAHELVGVIELTGLGFESAHVTADTDVVHKEADTRSMYLRAATAERTRFECGV